ncbi:CDP-diacylglycerol--serine O-phosphatidyltransferase [Mangrovivirga cuniculi]|uniref:CDP-diacylglycerol--serine O-phosphatidyltransferase n=1 Tax=Mangrovivirga cuniculi TaxID=2715131 RepID=UPI002938CFF8|nr:CDP-diacylglycerol--serine O-phosphatidyltransferase [Mangrovivirga cuniculi]
MGISFAFSNRLDLAAYMIWIAGLMDFFDGFAARLLKVSSPIGKELDSLADVVSFGVLPGFIMYHLIDDVMVYSWVPYLSALIPIMSAIRLAKFNVDDSQTYSFIGLPTPAHAIYISSLPLIINNGSEEWIGWFSNPHFLMISTVVFSFMLVSKLPLIAFKFKSYDLKANAFKYMLLFLSIIILVILGVKGIPFVFLAYIIMSILENQLASSQ